MSASLEKVLCPSCKKGELVMVADCAVKFPIFKIKTSEGEGFVACESKAVIDNVFDEDRSIQCTNIDCHVIESYDYSDYLEMNEDEKDSFLDVYERFELKTDEKIKEML